ncbi:MAG: uroporphyrinogen decarboxylase family protein [Eubacteriales bacterium]|nr:uroporphyrinogen decarboxylase family protein [Eubacteriales bacterium]
MTERERFIKALKREPITGHVPTFELVFFLTMEVLGRVHPTHRQYSQWNQMTHTEKELHLKDMASIYIDIAKKYHHSAIFVHPNPGDIENTVRLLEIIREMTGDEYFIMMHGDSTFEIPNGNDIMDLSIRMYEDPDSMNDESKRRTESNLDKAFKIKERGGLLDGFALCSDYCFNTNPFFSPDIFADLIAPYLKQVIKGYRDMGYYSIKHTDGNIMPILDQLVDCEPDALHSIDPQGGVSLAEVKNLVGDRVTLCGNVNCGLLQTGTDEECIADVRRSLKEGMNGYGYIFCTSNCVYTGLPLERYEMMNKIWWNEGIYPETNLD